MELTITINIQQTLLINKLLINQEQMVIIQHTMHHNAKITL